MPRVPPLTRLRTLYAQDEAREAGLFALLPPLIRPIPEQTDEERQAARDAAAKEAAAAAAAADEETGGGGEGVEQPDVLVAPDYAELRQNAGLCVASLVSANKLSKEAARKAGCVEALLTLLDAGGFGGGGGGGASSAAASQSAYLAVMALQGLGMLDQSAQETAARRGEGAGRLGEKRAASLKKVWELKKVPSEWKEGRGGRSGGGGGGGAGAPPPASPSVEDPTKGTSANRRASVLAKRSARASLGSTM